MDRTRERMKGLPGRIGGPLALVASAALIAACAAPGGGASTAPTAAVTPVPATDVPMSAPPVTAAPTTAAAELTLELATDATLGKYVTGEDGLALYIFKPDAAAPGKSVCNGDCATAWPPLVVDAVGDVAAGTGVTGALGTVTRDDGSIQLTLGGNPLYYFAQDAAAGDVKGQGLNDVWYLAGADGKGVGMSRGEDPEY
jgi:predicted lipoprotein with Yx(FWY)xxD motif